MKKNVNGTDVNQVDITSLSHIKGQPQVTNTLKVHLRAAIRQAPLRSACRIAG